MELRFVKEKGRLDVPISSLYLSFFPNGMSFLNKYMQMDVLKIRTSLRIAGSGITQFY
jgi:hypothetical protein